ncbi:MAG: hypothetical protein AAF438_21260 [Pseudomonadota bacterium]
MTRDVAVAIVGVVGGGIGAPSEVVRAIRSVAGGVVKDISSLKPVQLIVLVALEQDMLVVAGADFLQVCVGNDLIGDVAIVNGRGRRCRRPWRNQTIASPNNPLSLRPMER